MKHLNDNNSKEIAIKVVIDHSEEFKTIKKLIIFEHLTIITFLSFAGYKYYINNKEKIKKLFGIDEEQYDEEEDE